MRLTFPFGRYVFLLCSAPSGLGLPLSWSFVCPFPPVCALFFLLLFSPLLFSARPLCVLLYLVSGPGCPGPWRCVLFVLLAPRFSALRALSPLLYCPPGRWLLPGGCPPPFFCVSRFLLPPLGALCFSFALLLLSAPRCLWLSLVSGPRCPGPWRCALCFFFASCCPALRALSPFLCLPLGRWLLPDGCCPPPPLSFCVSRFSSLPLVAWFFSFPLPVCSPVVFGFLWFPAPAALGLRAVFCLFCGPPAPRLSVPSRLVYVPRMAVGCSLVVAAPPRFVSRGFRRCRSVIRSFFFPALCAPDVSGFLWFPAPDALGLGAVRCLLCWPPAYGLSVRSHLSRASRLAVGCSLVVAVPPPLLCHAVFVAAAGCCVPCAVLCCVSLGVVLRRAAARCAARCCAFLCCVVLLRSFGAAACCSAPSGAARHPGALCFAALCFAVFPRAVCVLSWRGGAHCCSVLCFELCLSLGAVLCVPCHPRSVRCCALLCRCVCVVLFVWCVLLLAPGAVVRCCVLCCFLSCAVVPCWVWWPVVVCWWRFSVSVSLSGRLVCFPVVRVVCCGALLPCVVFCGAVQPPGAVLLCSAVFLRCCWCLLCPPVACRAVLCCAVGWLCCSLPAGGVCVLWCSFPCAVCSLSSPLCALLCLAVLAVVLCLPVSGAVGLCCHVVLCCRALLSFCGAVCACFGLLWPVVRRRAVLCCAVGCLCRFLPGGGVCVLWSPFPPRWHAKKKTIITLRYPASVSVSVVHVVEESGLFVLPCRSVCRRLS